MPPSEAKSIAAAAPTRLLAARIRDPLASASDSGALTAPPADSGAQAWLEPVLIALGGGGLLSLFLAKAAEL
jgi:hypothetical protein